MNYITYVELLSLMLHAKVRNHKPSGPGEEDLLKGFTIYSHERPSWSCDLDILRKLLFPLLKDALHEVWLCLAMRFLEIVNNKWTDDGCQSMGIL